MHFSPNTTIKKVTAWAIYQFEISEEDHKDAYLAIRGYSAPLIGNAHLGRFVMHDTTKLELDVKTLTRVSVTPESQPVLAVSTALPVGEKFSGTGMEPEAQE